MSDKLLDAFANAFNKHLDDCKQCSENPFDLCQVGAILLRTSVNIIAGTVGPL